MRSLPSREPSRGCRTPALLAPNPGEGCTARPAAAGRVQENPASNKDRIRVFAGTPSPPSVMSGLAQRYAIHLGPAGQGPSDKTQPPRKTKPLFSERRTGCVRSAGFGGPWHADGLSLRARFMANRGMDMREDGSSRSGEFRWVFLLAMRWVRLAPRPHPRTSLSNWTRGQEAGL